MCTIQFLDIEFVFHEYKITTSEHLLRLWVAEFESIVIWRISKRRHTEPILCRTCIYVYYLEYERMLCSQILSSY